MTPSVDSCGRVVLGPISVMYSHDHRHQIPLLLLSSRSPSRQVDQGSRVPRKRTRPGISNCPVGSDRRVRPPLSLIDNGESSIVEISQSFMNATFRHQCLIPFWVRCFEFPRCSVSSWPLLFFEFCDSTILVIGGFARETPLDFAIGASTMPVQLNIGQGLNCTTLYIVSSYFNRSQQYAAGGISYIRDRG